MGCLSEREREERKQGKRGWDKLWAVVKNIKYSCVVNIVVTARRLSLGTTFASLRCVRFIILVCLHVAVVVVAVLS